MAMTEYLPDGSCIVTLPPGQAGKPIPHDSNTPTLQDVAVMLTKQNPLPAWLLDGLRVIGPAIGVLAKKDVSLPPPKELQKRFDALGRAATLLLQEIRADGPLLAYMTRFGLLQSQHDGSIEGTIIALAEVECVARKSSAGIKPRAGRKTGPLQPSALGYLTSRSFCALTVIEVWTKLRGSPPSSQNGQAQEVADRLWMACGGPPLARDPSSGSLDRWRVNFDAARQVHNLASSGPPYGIAALMVKPVFILRRAFNIE